MLRALLVAALLALAAPAAAAPTPMPLQGEAPGEGLRAPVGSPLLRTQPEGWMPILRDDGYVAAIAAAQGQRQASEPEEKAKADDPEARVRHSFLPLGDVDGNGRDDVILLTAERDNLRFEALEGGRPDSVLWSFEVDADDATAYLAGDIDEDGVYDIERVSDAGESMSDDGMESEQRADVVLLSGRDLAQLTALQLTTRFAYEETRPQPFGLVGESSYHMSASFEFVLDLDDRPGFTRMMWRMEEMQRDERYVITTSSTWSFNMSSSIAVLDPAGALVWAFDEAGWQVGYGFADATGDGIEDVVVARSDEFGLGSYRMLSNVQPPVPPPVPLPILGDGAEERPPFQLRLLDGADGSLVWEQSLGNASVSWQSWLDDVFGEGPVLHVGIMDFVEDPSGYDFQERSYLIDGATGEVRHESAHGLNLVPLGDANGDGRDDMLRLDANDSQFRFQAVDGDFNELWDATLADDRFHGFVDVTGEGVTDLLDVDDRNVTIVSGTNGDPAWDRYDPRMAFVRLAPGIVEETDLEVAMLLSDAKDHEDLSDHALDLLMLRGSDGAALWSKPLYDPKDYLDPSAEEAYLGLMSAGDVNGDGARDLLVELGQAYHIIVSTTCDDDGECETKTEDSRDDEDGQPLHIAAIVDGATGETLLRFDDLDLAPKVKKVQEAPVDLKPAGEALAEEPAPAPAAIAALAAVALALLARRRRA